MEENEDYLCINLKDYTCEDFSSLRKQFAKASRIEVDCYKCESADYYDTLTSLLQSYCEKLIYIQLTNLYKQFQLNCLAHLPLSILQIHCYMKEAEEPDEDNEEEEEEGGRKFPDLFEFRRLRALTLSGFYLGPNSLRGIEELSNLYFLDMSESSVPPLEFDRIKNLTKLRHVYVSSCKLSDKILNSIILTNKNIQALDITSNQELTDRSMEKLCLLPDIRILNVMNIPLITDYYFEEMRKLTALNCQNCPLVTEAGLIKLISVALNLRYLDVKKCRVSNDLLESAAEVMKTRECRRSLEISVDTALKNKWEKGNYSCPLLIITDGTEAD